MYWNVTDKERLILAFESAKNADLLEKFLEDLFTEKELLLYIKRLKAACLIQDGASYKQIQTITGLGPATIAQISKKLKNKEGGFREILKKLNPNGESYFD